MNLDAWPSWLRWVLFLPAAILCALLVTFPIHWAVILLTSFRTEEESGGLSLWNLPPETLERCGYALIVPTTLILVARYVAPSHRIYVAGVLSLGWAVLLGSSLSYAGQSGSYEGIGWIEFVAVGLLGVAGIGGSLYTVYQEEHGQAFDPRASDGAGLR